MEDHTSDQELTSLVQLHGRWLHEGRSPKLARQLADTVARLRAELPPVHREYAESILHGVSGRSRSRAAPKAVATRIPWSSWIPVCNRGIGGPHVTLFTEYNGLVHGSVIRIGANTLACRAFHSFRMVKAGYTDVVAGVCDQWDGGDNLVQRWSTAERMTHRYQSATV